MTRQDLIDLAAESAECRETLLALARAWAERWNSPRGRRPSGGMTC